MSNAITPEQRQALKMAAHWYALLCDEHVTDRQRQQWQAWHQQHDDHRWAWQRVEALQSQLQGVPGKFSYRALDRAGRQSAIDRRTLLKSLLLLLGVGGGGFLYQSPLGRELRADYRTATGEIDRAARSVRRAPENGSGAKAHAPAVPAVFPPACSPPAACVG